MKEVWAVNFFFAFFSFIEKNASKEFWKFRHSPLVLTKTLSVKANRKWVMPSLCFIILVLLSQMPWPGRAQCNTKWDPQVDNISPHHNMHACAFWFNWQQSGFCCDFEMAPAKVAHSFSVLLFLHFNSWKSHPILPVILGHWHICPVVIHKAWKGEWPWGDGCAHAQGVARN